MSSLNASLAIALSGLAAEQGAMGATANNVANVNTPGYSRQVPSLTTSDPVVIDPLTLGTGVTLLRIDSVRNAILESQIQQETQSQGELGALVAALSQTETNFSSTTADVGTALSHLFDGINQLATSPADLSLRQNVLTAAGNLAHAFNVAADHLGTQRTSLDQSVEQTVLEINQLTQHISELNGRISDLQNVGESAGSFIDRRTQMIDELSSLIDVSVIPSGNTLTLTTANGSALVSGQTSFQFSTGLDSSGSQQVFSQGNNVTKSIVSGSLAGLLKARDQHIPATQRQLDVLAASLANALNGIQSAGYDLHGNTGSANLLFNPPPPSVKGAAASFSVAIDDPSLIAASSDGTAGSNGNAEAMYALRNAALIDGQSPTDYYSTIVFNVGNASANAKAEQGASELVLTQLNNQRSAVSGVSLDEEAANLMRFQQAYAASAQVITAINQMMQDVINMKAS
jgi:flagellar hook-associated protein 1